MNPISKALRTIVAGALAALATSLIIWLFSITGLFSLLHVPVDASHVGLPWFVERVSWGGLWGLLFLLPLFRAAGEWKRGLLFGWVPGLWLLLWSYPQEGRGLLGLNAGILLPVTAVAVWLLWGVLAGLWLAWGGNGDEPEEEPLTPG